MTLKKIGILLFNGAELLDFAGPIQVFSSFHYLYPEDCDQVITIGITPNIQVSKIGMEIIPDTTLSDFQDPLDLLIIPGGIGTRTLIKDQEVLENIETLINRSGRLATVCTGSLVAARLGRLKNLRATTHYAALDLLSELDNTIIVDRTKRYHDYDHIIVSEGVSAGIDMSFYLLSKFYGAEKSESVRKYIEYYPQK